MPTNQSSPWGRGNLRTCPTTGAPVSTRAKMAVATEVPLSQLSRREDEAKPLSSSLASSAPTLRQTTPAPCLGSVWEDGQKTNPERQLTTVPDASPKLLQSLPGVQNQELGSGLRQAGSSVEETSASSSISKKECVSFQACGAGDSLAMSQCQPAPSDAQIGLEPLCHEDLFRKGQASQQQTNKPVLDAADCSSLPPVPPPRLTLHEQQGAALGNDASSLKSTKVKGKSTRVTTILRRSRSAKLGAKCSRTQTSCTTAAASNSELVVRGGPPATTSNKPQKTVAQDGKTQSQCPPGCPVTTCRKSSSPPANPFPNSPMPRVLSASATQENKAPLQGSDPDEASCPARALVGSVTSRISTIHLTRQGQLNVMSSAPSPSSPSPEEECLAAETLLSGQECVMQVDGAEEDFPDELENACSDDDASGCSSAASIACLSRKDQFDPSLYRPAVLPADMTVIIEEPMFMGQEDDREEKPALVPSMFPLMPPTLYFSTANEKVELLPVEQRRLLKWKISTVTPNVVKHTIGRSHFKPTKKSHDWLGCWGHHMKSPCFKSILEHQKLNHFPGTFQIGRKDRLWRNLSKMQVRFGKQEFSFFPRTFVLPQDIKLLRKAWEDSGSRQKWIIKPPASARGIGIQVIHKWSQMPRKRPLLVQKYLSKPYLIGGNKFDLRIYVYVTTYDPLRIYIFSDGLVRFASCKYSSSMKTLGNKFMHLTNYSVNKKNSEYQTNSDDKACQGHKWALKALWQYLGSRGVNTTLIWEKIKDIVIKTIIASEPYVNSLLKMNVKTPYSCHELFGFDIMLDENLKPWILEVNISPSLHSNTALDVSIKGQMIRDLLNLAGFRIPQREDVMAPCSSASSSTSSLCSGSRERTKTDLSADEKVKRAFYLTQRYADQDFLSSVLDVLTPEDVRVLAESEDELSRRGEFERVFPSPSSSRYLRFFECPRYLNILLDQWEQKHWSNRTKGVSLLTTLCQKGVHLGTRDPAHVWSKCSYISKFEPHRQELASPSRSRVVVSHQHSSHHDRGDGSDKEVASYSSLPVSPSPGSSVTSSACTSPQPSLSQSLLPQHFASL